MNYDAIVIGGGIVGISHAYYLSEKGLKVALLEKDARPIESSIRNFGFVTISGQIEGKYWQYSKDSAVLWKSIAEKADIPILQTGSLLKAQTEEAMAVLRDFKDSDMGDECKILTKAEMLEACHCLNQDYLVGGMYSPYEVRIDPVQAISQLHKWLGTMESIDVYYDTEALHIETGKVTTRHQDFFAEHIIVCPSTHLKKMFPEIGKELDFKQTKLHMLEIELPKKPNLKHVLMSDTSMVFYKGFANQPSGGKLRKRMESERPYVLEQGINTIIAQQENGNLVIGDSHEYLDVQDPFYREDMKQSILKEIGRIINIEGYKIHKQWIGYYPYSDKEEISFKNVEEKVHLATVNRGKGMSISWAWAKENIDSII